MRLITRRPGSSGCRRYSICFSTVWETALRKAQEALSSPEQDPCIRRSAARKRPLHTIAPHPHREPALPGFGRRRNGDVTSQSGRRSSLPPQIQGDAAYPCGAHENEKQGDVPCLCGTA